MLNNTHALVTGGGTGIGLAIARALADNGSTVTITGRRKDVLEEAAGDTLHPLVMDVTNETSVEDGVAKAVAARGPVQICVPNAGVAEGRSLTKTDTEFWRWILTTNLDGAFWTIRACLPGMQETNWGRVIAVSSIAGLRGLRGAPAYSASKHGLIGMIRSLSEDYMGAPYTFNALCPAYVRTDIVTRNQEAIQTRAGVSAEDALDMMVRANRHRRLIEPEEVAATALWLCAPGSESINGQTIEIAGGQC
ncbi:MAG: SDR family oxidoreductase [Pseudomonadota bacterium]